MSDRRWRDAALQLNGYEPAELDSAVASISRVARINIMEAILVHAPGAELVPSAITRANPEEARIGRAFAACTIALRDKKWEDLALALNGLSNQDIITRLQPLTDDDLRSIQAAAQKVMPGWDQRVTDPINLLLDKETRPGLTGEPVFENPGIKKVYEENAASISARQRSALMLLDRPLSGKWTWLNWADIAASAAARVWEPAKIDQAVLSICATAAAVQANAAANALAYATMVRHIFATGEYEGTTLNKKLLQNTPAPNMDQCDWMVLSAVQDAANLVRDFEGRDTDPVLGGIAPEGSKDWNIRYLLKHVNGCVKVEHYSAVFWGELSATDKVSALMTRHGDAVVVMIDCDGTLLDNIVNQGKGFRAEGATMANHAVRLLTPVRFEGGQAVFTIYSWGKALPLKWPLATFVRFIYGYYVGAKREDIDIDV